MTFRGSVVEYDGCPVDPLPLHVDPALVPVVGPVLPLAPAVVDPVVVPPELPEPLDAPPEAPDPAPVLVPAPEPELVPDPLVGGAGIP